MNYYKRHIGDYMKDASHLSLLEHGIYMRLLDVYYTRESAIPVDQAARLIGARGKDEKEALSIVAGEFFTVTDGCFTQARCDREIAIAREFSEEADGRKANEAERQQRHRARRKDMFDTLRSRGIVPAWDASTEKLKQFLDMPVTSPVTFQVTSPVTQPVTDCNAPETAITSNQKPVTNNQTHTTAVLDQTPDGTGVPVCVLICKAMRTAGIGDANDADTTLAVLVGKGATLDAFVAAVPMALAAGKGFAYVLGIVKNQMTAAAVLAVAPMAAPVARSGKPDVSRVTVAARPDADAALRHLAADAAIPRNGPPPELRARLAQRKSSTVSGQVA